MTRPRICVVGASMMDLISYITRPPKLGETLAGKRFHMGFGGKGANQAVMASKLGGEVSIVTKLGQDMFGEGTMANFEKCGLHTEHVLFTDKAFSGVAPITVDPEGHNSIIIVTGSNDLLTTEEIEAARPAISASQILICQLEIPLEISLAALRAAREEGVTTYFNPSPAIPDLPREFYELSDVICPNEGETEVLTGKTVNSPEEAESAARELIRRGAGEVVLTLGTQGCFLLTETKSTHVPAVKVKAVDTTGAGDCFLGSLAFFAASGLPMPEAIRRANTVASMSVQASGTQSSFPSTADLPPELLSDIL